MSDSWRNDVPDHVQAALDECFGCVLDLAVHLLEKNGEFFPVGAALEAGADRADYLGVMTDDLGEQPESQAVLDRLYAAAATRGDAIAAAAFACDVSLVDGRDAVRVEVEHREGPALQIVVPYRRDQADGTIAVGEMAISEGTGRL